MIGVVCSVRMSPQSHSLQTADRFLLFFQFLWFQGQKNTSLKIEEDPCFKYCFDGLSIHVGTDFSNSSSCLCVALGSCIVAAVAGEFSTLRFNPIPVSYVLPSLASILLLLNSLSGCSWCCLILKVLVDLRASSFSCFLSIMMLFLLLFSPGSMPNNSNVLLMYEYPIFFWLTAHATRKSLLSLPPQNLILGFLLPIIPFKDSFLCQLAKGINFCATVSVAYSLNITVRAFLRSCS